MLHEVISDIKHDRRSFNKALVIFLDDTDCQYNPGFANAGMSMTECIGLCEVMKTIFIGEMGFHDAD